MSFSSSIERVKTFRAKQKALAQFRSMNDRMLFDCNVSRDLLDQGIAAWPWVSEAKLDAPTQFADANKTPAIANVITLFAESKPTLHLETPRDRSAA